MRYFEDIEVGREERAGPYQVSQTEIIPRPASHERLAHGGSLCLGRVCIGAGGQRFGIVFFGSRKGSSATRPLAGRPKGQSTSTTVPTPENSIGTHM